MGKVGLTILKRSMYAHLFGQSIFFLLLLDDDEDNRSNERWGPRPVPALPHYGGDGPRLHPTYFGLTY